MLQQFRREQRQSQPQLDQWADDNLLLPLPFTSLPVLRVHRTNQSSQMSLVLAHALRLRQLWLTNQLL